MKRLHQGTAAAALAMAFSGAAWAQDTYTIGISNTVQGNGWREEMICAMKAQALDSGAVESLNIAHRNTDAAGQLEDIRNLIQAGVDAIVVNPASPEAVNPAIKEATDAGIVVVAVDQAVTEPTAYLLANNQEEYGYRGARWLFQHLGGQGNIVYMRGAAGAPADTDRDRGVRRALQEFPNIKIVAETQTGWDQATGVQQINDFLATGQQVNGVWTSGIDNVIVDAFKTAGRPFVPIVGADNSGFVQQLLAEEGLEGAAVTNPAAIGAAGLKIAFDVLDGKNPKRETLLTPEVWDAAEDRQTIEEFHDPKLPPTYSAKMTIEGFTNYKPEQLTSCQGPSA